MDKDKKESLENLKKNYSKLQEEFNLPSFDEMNKDFNIERISELNTEIIIREIRKFMVDKMVNYLRFIETFLNPSNAPIFMYSIVKSLSPEEKNKFQEIYKKLAKLEIMAIKNDLNFSSKNEAEFINYSFTEWERIKKDILKIIGNIEDNWDKKSELNGKSYFG